MNYVQKCFHAAPWVFVALLLAMPEEFERNAKAFNDIVGPFRLQSHNSATSPAFVGFRWRWNFSYGFT